MDRISQLKNVAFGGAWSEQIAGDEVLKNALSCLEQAAVRTVEEDLRFDAELRVSVQLLAKVHPKGADLVRAFEKALEQPLAGTRFAELSRLHGLFKLALVGRLGQ